MSFIRSKQIPPKTGNFYDYEVQTIHENGRVRQRVIQYIGRSGTVKDPVLKGDIYTTDSPKPAGFQVSDRANTPKQPNLKVEAKNKKIETVNSITKALRILELFSENDGGLTLGDITKLTGVNKSTVSHVVSTLYVNGFLCQPVNRGKYYLGVNFLNIAEALNYEDSKKITISYLAELSRLVNGTVGLKVWHGHGMKAKIEQLGTNITDKQNWVKQNGVELKDISFEIRNGEEYPVGVIFPVDFTIRSTFHALDKLISSIRVCALKISRALAEKPDEMIDAQSTVYIPGWDLKENINIIKAFDKRLKTVNSITKALRILKVFSENDNGLTVGDIAKSAGLARSTVSRLVSTLAINGFLVQLKKRGKYYLGVRFLDIAGTIKSKNRDSLIISCLLELSQIVDMPVYLEVMHNSREWIGENVDFYKEDSNVNESITTYLRSCAGKIVLANLDHTDLRKYFRYTYLNESLRKIKGDIGRLKADLVVIRQKQVAYGSEDVIFGLNGIATGIKNNEGALIGVLYIVGDSNRLTNTKLKDIIPIVRTYKLMISKALIPSYLPSECKG